MATEHPMARFRSISSTYNCVGMVFAARRTWVDPEDVLEILKDDGYRPVTISDVSAGDLIVYRDRQNEIVHLGVIYEKRPQLETGTWDLVVLSKWGANAEYLHPASHVPVLLGSRYEFWTERQEAA